MDEWRAALAAMEAGNFTPSDNSTKKTNDRYVMIRIILCELLIVVVYHVTTVASGHGLLKNFGPVVIECVLLTVNCCPHTICTKASHDF